MRSQHASCYDDRRSIQDAEAEGIIHMVLQGREV